MKIQKYIDQSPAFALNLASNLVMTRVNAFLKKEKVNLLQGLTLTALFFEDRDTITPSELAKALQTTRTNMSHILSELESRTWIKRVLDEEDSRRFYIRLKPEGRKKAIQLIRLYDEIQEGFEKRLGIENCQKLTRGLALLTRAADGV